MNWNVPSCLAVFLMLVLVTVLGCENNRSEVVGHNKEVLEETNLVSSALNVDLEKNEFIYREFGLRYSGVNSCYNSDTMFFDKVRWIAYGKIKRFDYERTAFFTFDSLIFLNPEKNLLIGYGQGGYLYKNEENRAIQKLVDVVDLNDDEYWDVMIANHSKSGASGNYYKDPYLWKDNKFVFSQKYVIANLRYIDSLDLFYSSYNLGGGERYETLFKAETDELKVVR